ncbi:GNAT family N-acetyltransferase [Hymenobacter amundsenii]|uniref:GNAT family N-acetyltransferase n=1 Tax=Hymenobacter amundsenii TaxID=2006685 RepID=A0A246FKB4_9BACT|nr:GNAT family N-acetyltransferase [Hymenobacter amundsenii]OWP62981.1 GNAT family N-acetyltransferase [Hymenobacter amundsenii]
MTPLLTLLDAPLALVPQLETPDLLLRAPLPSDLPEFTAISNDPAFYRFLGNKPQTEEEVWRRMMGQLGHWAMFGYGAWTIEEKATGSFLGSVGFFDFQRDLTPSLKGTLETGWTIAPRAHGRGYATQALQAALAWVEPRFPAARLTAIIDPANVASLAVARKFHFHEFARATYHHEPIVLLERTTN